MNHDAMSKTYFVMILSLQQTSQTASCFISILTFVLSRSTNVAAWIFQLGLQLDIIVYNTACLCSPPAAECALIVVNYQY